MFYRLDNLIFAFLLFLKICLLSQNNSRINLKEDIIINSVEIGRINGVQIDAKGQIFISDGINQCIHLFSPNGKFIQKIGRKGKGPGEFQYIWGTKITKGDSLVVYDGVQYRITIYSPGKYDYPIKTIKIPSIEKEQDKPGVVGKMYSGINGLWLPQNNSKEFLIIYNTPYTSNDLTQEEIHYSKLYRIDSKGRLIQNKPILKIPAGERLMIPSTGGGFMISSMPFGKNPVINLSKDGIIYYAVTDNFKITSIEITGKLKNEISYKVDNIYVGERLWQDELKNYSLDIEDVKKSKTALPKYLPIFDDFAIDDQENVWVAVNDKDYKSYKYYLFNSSGKLISVIPVKNKTVIKIIRDNLAYGINTDDSGIQSVVKYKVEHIIK